MRIVFNELGVITSHNFSEQGDSLRQGSVGNVLVAKLTNAINTNLIATLNFTRPDGTAITDVLMDNQGTDEFKIKFSDPWYFALSGNATLTIFVRDSGGNIAAQGQVQVPIESTDYDGYSVAPITNAQYTELLARIAGKLNRTGASEIGDALSFVDNEGNIVFSWTKSNGGLFRVPMSFSNIEVATLTINGYAAATESYVQTELLPYATKSYVVEKINEIVLDPFELKTDATIKYNELNGKIADVRAVAEGKTKSYTISTEDNEIFNSQNASLSGVTSIKDISGNVIQVSSLKNGDVVLVVEIDVPDRWYSSVDGKFYILETQKVDLSPYSAHVANGDIHVTAEDKSNWNGKSVVSGSGTGSSTTPISYITINGVEYAIIPAQLNAVWGQISGSIANQTDLKNALDAKQNALTFDSTPTQNSNNPVTSGGVHNAIDGVAKTHVRKVYISALLTPTKIKDDITNNSFTVKNSSGTDITFAVSNGDYDSNIINGEFDSGAKKISYLASSPSTVTTKLIAIQTNTTEYTLYLIHNYFKNGDFIIVTGKYIAPGGGLIPPNDYDVINTRVYYVGERYNLTTLVGTLYSFVLNGNTVYKNTVIIKEYDNGNTKIYNALHISRITTSNISTWANQWGGRPKLNAGFKFDKFEYYNDVHSPMTHYYYYFGSWYDGNYGTAWYVGAADPGKETNWDKFTFTSSCTLTEVFEEI